MKHLCVVIIVSWFGVMDGHVDPQHSSLLLKASDNIAEVYRDNGDGSSWLQMLLLFARDSANSQSASLIQDKPSTQNIKTPDNTIGCKEGFIQLESRKCYFFSNQKKEWQEALEVCQSMGTTLAYPVNAMENSALVNYLKTNRNGTRSGWYLGGRDEGSEGNFVWAHSKSSIIYNDWLKGQPDNYKGIENCVHIWEDYGWQWNDVPCNRSLTFICQH